MELMINNVKGFKVAMTSIQIAELTGKEQGKVIRDIEDESDKLGVEIAEAIFEMASYKDKNNQPRKMYNLTENGIKKLISRYKNITPEQYKAFGINDIDVVYNHTRFEISFGNMLEEYLNEFGIEIDKQFNIDGYKVDFYIPSKNICVEYDEKQHFTTTHIDKDLERQKYIEDRIGCKFVRCDYRDSDIKNLAKVTKEMI